MWMHHQAVVLLLVCAAFGQVWSECGPWIAVNVSSLTPADPDDIVTMYYLLAPLLECQYGNEFVVFNAYHGGIGFNTSQTSVTVNFEAYPNFTGAILPTIIRYPNKTIDLLWENNGRVFVYEGINSTYWTIIQEVGYLTGEQYNTLLEWVGTINSTSPWYDLWSVYDEWPGTPFIKSQDCFSFVWELWNKTLDLGGTLTVTEDTRSLITAFSRKAPAKVDMSSSSQRDSVVKFYEALETKIKDLGLQAFLEAVADIIIKDQFYVRSDADYYKIDTYFPYLSVHWENFPLPNYIPPTTLPPPSVSPSAIPTTSPPSGFPFGIKWLSILVGGGCGFLILVIVALIIAYKIVKVRSNSAKLSLTEEANPFIQ